MPAPRTASEERSVDHAAAAGPTTAGAGRTVALVTLGCARNEVDSEELAGRLEADGWRLTEDAADAAVVLVNTCGFVESAKKDSIDTVLEAADLKKEGGPTQAVVAVGCMAERYGGELAGALPEADAVLGFDDYEDIAGRLRAILAGEKHTSHVPRDRRKLLPLSPVERQAAAGAVPGHGAAARASSPDDLPSGVAPASGPRTLRKRLGGGPVASVKLASGCDRRCSFCAIPSFRGSFLSRRPTDVVDEVRWLAGEGVREIVLVSENSTSYGKDLGDLRLLEALLPELAAVDGIERVRVNYLQPAEMRPDLIGVLTGTDRVVPYFDLSFQHAAEPVLRRMRRFGSRGAFIDLLDRIRAEAPEAGARSNFIVGFPGETEEDLDELTRFLTEARLDAIGVFGYSDEEGTEAAGYDGKLPDEEVARRLDRVSRLAEELTAQRAEERVGSEVTVLVEEIVGVDDDGLVTAEGRAAHQAPEIDGLTVLHGRDLAVGTFVRARVVGSEGVDLYAEELEASVPGPVAGARDRTAAASSGPAR
ncbi:30S ribosomal protein S12 methylthiotransferase RimO [Yinghuangia sp. ASG 101]|uniref:30S ribosomal protein S12 methylthiotransferase RimO n=1 Tax=Yinghuangia sp. ASG 101 TaxID=2896848 RepID=UPI001E32843A|nr:30S ribosomal protein S12 methylthiotransferase RimO [Yinghuangia sp. ASG 101]UGQ09926.1 30S ribosomal protein S12 methylthiotransferase RimO [Yinghuangia sp. ASG 101]